MDMAAPKMPHEKLDGERSLVLMEKKTFVKTTEDTLWRRIKKRAEKEKTSYWAVSRKVALEYWNDYRLTKEP